MTTWHEYKASQLKDPDVKKEYDALEWEYALITARQKANMETLQAVDDVNNHRGLSRKFSSVDELMEDLNA